MNLRRGDGGFLRVGHRGAAALAPENTLEALEAALAHGVDAVEVDVLDAGEGPLVLGHSLAELVAAPATLDEALDLLRDHDAGVHLDLKLTTRLDEVAAALGRHGLTERAVASSFHLPSLRALAAADASLRRGLTYPEDRFGVSKRPVLRPVLRAGTLALRRAVVARIPAMVAGAGAHALMLHHAVVTRPAVARAHAAGAAVWAWTVDDPEELARLDAAGVDAVISNDPRIFQGPATLAP